MDNLTLDLDRLLGLDGVTCDTPVTPDASVVPRWTKPEAAARVGVSERTLLRYWAEYRDRGVLTAEYGADGVLRFSDEDVEFLRRVKAAKSEAAKEGIAQSQRERIAQLTAGSPSRRAAEQVRRELRALADSGHLPTVSRRVAALLERFPGLQRLSPMHRLAVYYATYHVTTDLVQLAGQGAPPVGTVDRAFRRLLQQADKPPTR